MLIHSADVVETIKGSAKFGVKSKIENIKTIHICKGYYSPICKKSKFDLIVNGIKALSAVDFTINNII